MLALHGGVAEHVAALAAVGAEPSEVRAPDDLAGLHGLVLPGGETTTLRLLAPRGGLLPELRGMVAAGTPTFGTCAGLIALADVVDGRREPLVGGLRIAVRRNAYGRQTASFEAPVDLPSIEGDPMVGVFVRAPRVVSVGDGVEVLALLGGDPVAVRQGHIWATAFHPELTPDRRLHAAFVEDARAWALPLPTESGEPGGVRVRA